MPEFTSLAKLSNMATDNLTDLIEILQNHEEYELDLDLEDGQVLASDGTIVTL